METTAVVVVAAQQVLMVRGLTQVRVSLRREAVLPAAVAVVVQMMAVWVLIVEDRLEVLVGPTEAEQEVGLQGVLATSEELVLREAAVAAVGTMVVVALEVMEKHCGTVLPVLAAAAAEVVRMK